MEKFILVLHMCSMISGQCPSSTVAGYQYSTHYDCVASGYKLAHNTFLALEQLEEWDKDHVEKHKMVVKFECRSVKILIPLEKPKV